jgi:hypothetical protein
MFGHNNSDDQTQVTEDTSIANVTTDAIASDEPQEELTLPPMPVSSDFGMQTPVPDVSSTDATTAPVVASTPEPVPDAELSTHSDAAGTTSVPAELDTLKQEALRELSPLIGHLDQTPDEKYTFAKMIYEETKNQDMLSKVYEAAKGLTDEKAKAKAIYDIIEKINSISSN